MSKSQLDVLSGLNLIKKDGDRPHYLPDTQATLDEARADSEVDEGDVAPDEDDEPLPAAVEQVDALVKAAARIVELEAYIAQRVEVHAATRSDLIKKDGELVTARGNLKHCRTLLSRAKLHIQRLTDQQAMPDDKNDEDAALLVVTLEGMGL